MKSNQEAVILVSGGIDSAVLLALAKKERGLDKIIALTFKYGQKHEKEINSALKITRDAGVKEHFIINLDFFPAITAGASALIDHSLSIPALQDLSESERVQPLTYVPNRNLIFISIAASLAESRNIPFVMYGAHRQDNYGYWDCSEAFINAVNSVLSLNRKNKIEVVAPFINMEKYEIIKTGMKLGVNFSLTWSCYTGDIKPCGKCPTCVEREKAFQKAGISDPLK